MDSTDNSSIPEIVVLATYNLVKDYLIRRKDTVIRVLLEVRPNFVIGYRHEQIVGIVDIARYHEYYQEYLQQREKSKESDHIGIWRGEWDYFIHGIGCRLMHQETK